ncbi:MAG: GNAT family N-acetyltransferase [Oscillospiraceae bacterium]|jgi:ribosomal protein S18 acetylase RimI-like enzyme|nr:GNAT family N-acetyltransferase [Oscillospiraceae bacterium]
MYPIEPITERTRALVTAFIEEAWNGTYMIIRGEVVDMTKVDGFVWMEPDGQAIRGLITYIVRGSACEIASLNSQRENQGVGTALVELVKAKARELGCARLQLLTTNDNINAIKFYQKRGFELAGVNLGAIDRERALKPAIPLIGQNGIPIRHEIEFVMELT